MACCVLFTVLVRSGGEEGEVEVVGLLDTVELVAGLGTVAAWPVLVGWLGLGLIATRGIEGTAFTISP